MKRLLHSFSPKPPQSTYSSTPGHEDKQPVHFGVPNIKLRVPKVLRRSKPIKIMTSSKPPQLMDFTPCETNLAPLLVKTPSQAYSLEDQGTKMVLADSPTVLSYCDELACAPDHTTGEYNFVD